VNDSPFLPLEINTPVFDVLQRFVVILYDRTSLATDVSTARRELFTKKNRALENIPPTEVRTYHTQNSLVFVFAKFVYDRLTRVRTTRKELTSLAKRRETFQLTQPFLVLNPLISFF